MKHWAIPAMCAAFWCFAIAAKLIARDTGFAGIAVQSAVVWVGVAALYLAHQWMHSADREGDTPSD